jgi:splicing factor 3B subunit 3
MARRATVVPRRSEAAFINVYAVTQEGRGLALLHQTPVEDIPYAMTPFHGRLLVGVQNMVRIYDLGKKRLLRKCEAKVSRLFISFSFL